MNKVTEELKKLSKEHHYLGAIVEEPHSEGTGPLSGIHVSVKDCVCVKGVESTASSAILKGYLPVFDATVIERVKKAGGIIIGKTVQDEFGFGGFSVNVGKGVQIPLNPFDKTRSCGGSSGGAAGLTQKASFKHIAIAESTGGSIVDPASFCGVIGLCPTYGRVPRYGLMDYGSSLDKIGIMAKAMEDVALGMEVIAGHDPKDSTSLADPVPKYTQSIDKPIKGMRIAIVSETLGEGCDPRIKKLLLDKAAELKKHGAVIEQISLPFVQKYSLPTYYILALCEASTNLAKYCGMRYGATEKLEGSFNDYFSKVRGNYFGDEAKRRIILGTFARMSGYRDAYYITAAKVRTKIISEYKDAFKEYDLLLTPTMPVIAPKFDELKKLTPLQNFLMDIMTCGPNLAGLPHITVPAGTVEGMPVGLMLVGDHLQEAKCMQVGKKVMG